MFTTKWISTFKWNFPPEFQNLSLNFNGSVCFRNLAYKFFIPFFH